MQEKYRIDVREVRQAASGRWLSILGTLAPELSLAIERVGRHVPCPVHGGKDGFRLFKNADETGGGVSNKDGTFSNGFDLLMWVNNWTFGQALKGVSEYLNGTQERYPIASVSKPRETNRYDLAKRKQAESDQRLRQMKNITTLWGNSFSIADKRSHLLVRYLANRGIRLSVDTLDALAQSDSVRFNPALPWFDEEGEKVGDFPAMICAVRAANGRIVTLHRTWLTNQGEKAELPVPRKLMPAPDGVSNAAIQLGMPENGVLGIAEGVETALSAWQLSGTPTWSTVNATLMESVSIPEDVYQVIIWADNDKSETGQRAAQKLQTRLFEQGIKVSVWKPMMPFSGKSVDWNDALRGVDLDVPTFLRQGKSLATLQATLH